MTDETIGAQVTALAKWERSSSRAGLANVLQPVLVANSDEPFPTPAGGVLTQGTPSGNSRAVPTTYR